MKTAEHWICDLNLEEHPEGGYFKETYRAEESISQEELPDRFDGPRVFSTAVYFLLTGDTFSAFHRIRSDELWHFYVGSELVIHVIQPDGEYRKLIIGSDGPFQAVVPAGCWFAAEGIDSPSYTLVGCTVSPGFDFADFELAERSRLADQFPQHRALIERLTRL